MSAACQLGSPDPMGLARSALVRLMRVPGARVDVRQAEGHDLCDAMPRRGRPSSVQARLNLVTVADVSQMGLVGHKDVSSFMPHGLSSVVLPDHLGDSSWHGVLDHVYSCLDICIVIRRSEVPHRLARDSQGLATLRVYAFQLHRHGALRRDPFAAVRAMDPTDRGNGSIPHLTSRRQRTVV